MDTLLGLFEFEVPLVVRGDVLGETYDIKVGQQSVTLHFPKLPDKPTEFSALERELIPPSSCQLKCHESWGQLRSYNSTDYDVLSCCADVFQIYLECCTENPDAASDDILTNIDEWRNLLKQVICLEAKHASENIVPISHERGGIHLFKINPSFTSYDPHSTAAISVTIIGHESALSKEKLCNIFENIKCGKKLKLEYELLTQAYEERSRGNYRYALVQALSAVEMCIGNKIAVLCDEKGIDAKRLIGKKSLGDKFEVLKAFGVEWPTPNPSEEITKHRNDLFHIRLLSPTIKHLNDVIGKVEVYLQTYSPSYFE